VSLPSTSSLNIGSSVLIQATVLPANATNNVLVWSSSNTAIATVNSNGLISGVSAGTVTITASSTDGSSNSATCSVTVNIPVCSAAGNITYQVWNNIGGSTLISSLTGNINYPNNPTTTTLITSMEGVTNQANEYGSRIVGYLCAPETGSYTFWMTSDNQGELWLSTNDQPANVQKIAYVDVSTLPRAWNSYSSQKSAPVNLVKGQSYYIEALMKEAYGGDCLAVGWLKPGQTGTVPSEVIPGSVLSPLGSIKAKEVTNSNFEQATTDIKLEIYPNPLTNNELNIIIVNLFSKATLKIFTISGVEYFSKEIQESELIKIDRSIFVGGIYIVKVFNDNFVKSTKLIVN
jgi:transglutaminase/protease-like cytokinesis protein 3